MNGEIRLPPASCLSVRFAFSCSPPPLLTMALAVLCCSRWVFAPACSRFFAIKAEAFLSSAQTKRLASASVGYSLAYKEYGDPKEVLHKVEFQIPQTIGQNEVLVEMLAAPINPADINTIQGTYAYKPELPAVGGFEGVARVSQVGPNVKTVRAGDWVIPTGVGNPGTWSTHKLYLQDHVIKVPNDISVFAAATLAVNPCTAYRMLVDFESLSPGDTIIQNGANSGVGQAVLQIAEQMGLTTINIVRPRPDIDKLKATLQEMGAHHVLTTEEMRNAETVQFLKSLPHPKLALNCVGGKIATDMARFLAHGGTMVTYGGMSRQPVTIPTSALIFKDIKLRGFWMSRWKKVNSSDSPQWQEMLSYLLTLIRAGTLLPPSVVEVTLDNYKTAVEKAFEPYVNKKFVFVFNKA